MRELRRRKRMACRRVRAAGRRVLCVSLSLSVAFAPLVHALPTGGQVVAGSVASAVAGTQMTLNQASRAAIMNWQRFNIGSNESVRILQSGAGAAMLARVTGGNPSELLGRLQADGKLFLINPKGVVVGAGAVIDTGAFLASTLDVADADFLKGGALLFKGDSGAGIVNLGRIVAREGNVLLFAHTVKNAGAIESRNGTAGLAAATEVNLASAEDSTFTVKLNLPASAASSGVENSGVIQAAQVELKAAGGSIYDLAVNQSGLVRATGVERRPDGRVVLTSDGGTATVTGNVSARNADGSGGEILVGGGYQGKNPEVANAARTYVGPEAKLDASAGTPTGDGGKVVVWADSATRYEGSISARAGAQGGDGGSAEVSGKHSLVFAGTSDLSAPRGKPGTLLLDPDDITIVAGTTNPLPAGLQLDTTWAFADQAGAQTLGADSLAGLLLENSITLQATNTLTVNSPVVVGTGGMNNPTLTLQSNAISVNQNISLANAANSTLRFAASGANASLTGAAGATINAPTVKVDDFANATLSGPVSTSSLKYNATTGAATSFTASNASNTISDLVLVDDVANPNAVSFTGNVAVNSSTAMPVSALISGANDVTFSSGGNLTLRGVNGLIAASSITAGGTTKLAATGGGVLVNQAGAGLLAGAGRRLLYTSNTDGAFTLDGLNGYTRFDGVSYPNDPQGAVTLALYNAAEAAAAPTLTITADDFTKIYGQADPTFTASYSGGTSADLTVAPSFSILQGAHVDVGNYTIVPTGAASNDHTLAYVNGTLTIAPATLTYVANPFSRTYGAFNPTFGGTVTGFVAGDTLAGATTGSLAFASTATASSTVGSYPINGSGLVARNYVFAQDPGNAAALKIDPAPLSLVARSVSAPFGTGGSANGFDLSGLVLNDTAAVVTGAQLADPGVKESSAPGTYPITFASSGTAANYAITAVPGTFTVTRLPVTVAAPDASTLAGAVPASFPADAPAPLAFGPQYTVTAVGQSVNGSVNNSSPAGTYSLVPYVVPGANTSLAEVERYYDFRLVPGKLTLTSPPVSTVTFTQSVIITSTPIVSNNVDTTTTIVTGLTFDSSAVQDKLKTAFSTQESKVVVKKIVSGDLAMTPSTLASAAFDFGPDLIADVKSFLSNGEAIKGMSKEQVAILEQLRDGKLSLTQLKSLIQTDATARAAIIPVLGKATLDAVGSGKPLTYEQQLLVARIAKNVNTQRRLLKQELQKENLEFQIEKAEVSALNPYALKTMPDIAITSQQAATEQAIGAAIGAGAGAVIGGTAAAIILTPSVAAAIFPWAATTAADIAAGGAVGLAGAGAAATIGMAVAAIAIGVIAGVMVVQEQKNVDAYNSAVARASTTADLKLSNLDLKNDDISKTEFMTGFMMSMLEIR